MLEPLVKLDVNEPLSPVGHPFQLTVNNVPYLYFGDSYPNLRAQPISKNSRRPLNMKASRASRKRAFRAHQYQNRSRRRR